VRRQLEACLYLSYYTDKNTDTSGINDYHKNHIYIDTLTFIIISWIHGGKVRIQASLVGLNLVSCLKGRAQVGVYENICRGEYLDPQQMK
jgi:hypothetical protein